MPVRRYVIALWSKEKIGLNERIYQCPKCGHIEDRDINAAKNIRDEGIRLHRG